MTDLIMPEITSRIFLVRGDFMFQMTPDEADSLRLHFATINKQGRGQHRKYLPYVFTEHGAVMVSAILKTPIAIEASIHIARAFNELRRLLGSHRELAQKLGQLEKRYDSQFKVVFDAIRELMEKPAAKPLRIKGFKHE